MNWLDISYDDDEGVLYDISMLFLRCLRNFEKWS